MRIASPLPRITHDWQAFTLTGVGALLWLLAFFNVQAFAEWLTYDVLGISQETQLGASLSFFLYDVPKIFLLLFGMIFVITTLQTFVQMEKVRATVEKRGEGVGNFIAAVFGALTPFCSCSSVPLFMGFVQAGIPLGITFSFLITSPIMNEVALVMLWALFGWKVALVYLVSGITLGVIAGIVLGRMKLDRYLVADVQALRNKPIHQVAMLEERMTWRERFAHGLEGARDIFSKVWLFVLIGVGIGSLIHGFVPENALTGIMGAEAAWWSVPAAVAVGIPIYSGATGIIPIASALLSKGAALGTVLAFMMSAVALSFPEMVILRRVMTLRLLTIFVAIVAAGLVFTGYLFNLLAPFLLA